MSINSMPLEKINRLFGNIDLYLLDQLLKGRFTQDMMVLDAGCGEGRNLMYFLNTGHHVEGIDRNPDAIRMLQFVARLAQKGYPEDRFITGDLKNLPYQAGTFDLTLCNAVLHFAESNKGFWQMWNELARVTASGGYLFVRMTSAMGLDLDIRPEGDGTYGLPDGSVRFLLTREHWDSILKTNEWEPVEPLKVVSVDQQRGMATLLLRKK